MPTYVYKFLDSGETIEVQQAFTDDALTEAVHPADGVLRPVRKVFTPVGITFKGSGFYKTDSRSGAKTATKSNGSDSGASSDSKSDTSAASSSSDSQASKSKASDAKSSDTKSSDTKSSAST
jgi:predicted nucleic acid-binding Zn ribbon protein